jgi:hypothetical protein
VKEMTVDAIRERLREYISPEEGRRLRNQLRVISIQEYKPKRTADEYMKWIEENFPSFEKNHPQSTNHPYYLTMFSVASQHMAGDCIAECIDRHLDGQPERY